jgi:hypothetical protein
MRIPHIFHHSALAVVLTILDEIVRRLLAVPSARAFDATRRLLASHQAEIEATARHPLPLLCISSLMLLTLFVLFGLQLRRVSRRRSERTQAPGETDGRRF